MPTLRSLAAITCLCLTSACLVSCLVDKSRRGLDCDTLAKAILATVHVGDSFIYDVANVVPIVDGASREARWLCYVFGGPPTSTTGAVGVFDSGGRLLHARELKGLYAYITNASVLTQGDSAVVSVLDASGTGFHAESLVVLTLSGGKLYETFRCSGLSWSMHSEFHDQEVELVFRNLYGDGTSELIRLVTSNRYACSVDQQNGKPLDTKRTAEVFEFEPKAHQYVLRFD
ncbi:hypothetical protein G4L39_06935 [Limisphaera ngatamarikiensis]|uniref:Uncharacterized protein n=1 Tax=Limisphaera ngatamarikiensis TaxID=1324935 RepID=A0A6M1RN68_9BACT|nr:hypothetical protein [Limisphaera ngatamarikiensis]NGO39133.1 hypothetical protein [Limisphaera ngatamarikiensis]